jgi:hypothetical protein
LSCASIFNDTHAMQNPIYFMLDSNEDKSKYYS